MDKIEFSFTITGESNKLTFAEVTPKYLVEFVNQNDRNNIIVEVVSAKSLNR